MLPILLAHADGEVSLADQVAGPLRHAGYDVRYEGTVLVGESMVQEASKALGAGSPVVLCGTVAAMGTGWAHQVVNAARAHPGIRIFALQMEKQAYLQPLSLDGRAGAYWQDPGKAIGDLIKALREYYPLTAAAGHSSAGDLELRYRELALRTYDIVDLANLPVMDRNLATRELLLRSLYVALRVAVEPEEADGRDGDMVRGTASQDLESVLKEAGRAPGVVAKRRSVGELLFRGRRIVVLGDPGAGKSTLMRWMATAYLLRLNANPEWRELPDIAELPDENWLPILIRCRDLEETQAAASLEQILDHHLRKLGITGSETTQLNDLLLGRLSDGTALLLFDGLDEIAQTAARARFCRQVEQVHVTYPDIPIIATSRIVGYREMGMRIGRGFEHATVLDLTAQDKDEFVRRWCAVTEPVTRRESAEKELIADIHSTDRIERLTGNPMLLTTMALVKKKVGKLPSKRADLYREAVDVLLNWRSDVDELLDPYEAMPQLEYIAYAMCASGVQQLRADEIVTLLGKMRNEFPSVRATRRHEPMRFLQLLERRTGILVEIGRVRHRGRLVPAYEFRHLTFQEYLAGLALVEGRFPARNRKRSLAENVSPLAAQINRIQPGVVENDDPVLSENWDEALRLCVMSCNDDDVDGVLLAIADVREDEKASITARPRAVLAASCLSDEPNVSEDVAVKLIDLLVGTLRDADIGPGETITSRVMAEVNNSLWGPFLIRRLIAEWRDVPDRKYSLSDRMHLLSDREPSFGGYISNLIARHIPDGSDKIQIWLPRQVESLSDVDPVERIHACLSVMEAAYEYRCSQSAEKVRMVAGLGPGLISRLKYHGREAEAAAWAIGWLANSKTFVARGRIWKLSARQESAVVSMMKDPEMSAETTRFLLWALQENYLRDDDFAQVVLARLGDVSPQSRSSMIDDYIRLFPSGADHVISFVRRATGPMRITAVNLLGNFRSDRVMEALVGVLTDPDAGVRVAAAEILGRLGDRRAVEPLIAVLTDPDAGVRDAAACALGRLGDSRAVASLTRTKRMHGLVASSTVVAALATLGDESALREFWELMRGPSEDERRSALWALACLEPDPLDVILLSHDANGEAPGIDPEIDLRLEEVGRYTHMVNLTVQEVCARYERLQGKYLLRFAW